MATKLGHLAVVITARTSKFTKGLAKARKRLSGFGKGISKIAAYAASLSSVGSAVGMGLIIKNSLAMVDSISKTSDKLGIATKDLVGFHQAAELSGVSTKTMDMALQRMTRRIAEAAIGTGEAKGALKEMGLNAKALSAAGPGEAFKTIADAMARVPNQADKVRLSMKLFDSEGVALVNTLAMGRAGLDAVTAAAIKSGRAFTRKQGAAVEKANSAMVEFWGTIKGASTTLVVKLAPFITDASNRLRDFALAGEGLGAKIGKGFETAVMFARNFVEELTRSDTLMGSIIAKAKEMLGFVIQDDSYSIKDISEWKSAIAKIDKEMERLKSHGVDVAGTLYPERRQMFKDKITNMEAAKKAKQLKDAREGWGGGRWDDLGGNDKSRKPGIGSAARSSSFRQVAFSKAAVGGPGTTKTPIQADPAELTLLTSIRDLLKTNPTSVAVAG